MVYTHSIDATIAPRNVVATVVSSTVIFVQWDGLDPCRHVNGLIVLYRVKYTELDSGVVQSKDEAGEWNVTNAETSLIGLTPFTNYSIQVAAVNEEGDVGLYSDPLIRHTGRFSINAAHMCGAIHQICNTFIVPAQLNLTVDALTATSIFLSWTIADSEVDSYEVIWQRDTSGECVDEDEGSTTISDGSTSYAIMELEEDSSYSITVKASNVVGSTAVSDSITVMTLEAGIRITITIVIVTIKSFYIPSSICCSHICDCICSDPLQHQCPVGDGGLHPPQWRNNRLLSAVWGNGKMEYTDYKCLRK